MRRLLLALACLLGATAVPAQQPAAGGNDPPVLLSDQKTSYRILEAHQKIACDKTSSLACDLDPDACIRMFSEQTQFETPLPQAMIEETCNRKSTRYELPGVHDMLSRYYDEALAAARTLGFAMPLRPALGSLPVAEVNATISSPEDRRIRIIVVNLGFMTFVNTLVKSAAETIRFESEGTDFSISTDPQVTAERIRSNPEIVQRHVEGMLFSLGIGPGVPIGPKETYPIVVAYTEGSEIFALAHELAHLLLNHEVSLKSLAVDADCAATEEVAGARLDANWVQEMQADLLAHRIFAEVARARYADTETNLFVRHGLIRAPAYYFLLQEHRGDVRGLLAFGRGPDGPSDQERGALKSVLDCLARAGCAPDKAIEEAGRLLGDPRRHPHPAIRRQLAEAMALKANLPVSDESEAVLAMADLVTTGTTMLSTRARPVYGRLASSQMLQDICAKRGD